MASTYAAIAAITYAKLFINNAFIEQLSTQILDDVNKMFWMYAPWRWTLGSMPPALLSANTQDYPVVVPDDFLFLQTLWQYDGKTTRVIKPAAYLPEVAAGLHSGQINQTSVQEIDDVFNYRVLPVPGNFPSNAPSQQLIGLYKKIAPVIDITTATEEGFLQIPDEFFWVFEEGVLWRALYWAQDPRAGGVKVEGSQAAYSGQLARFMDALNQTREMEKLNSVDKQQEDKP